MLAAMGLHLELHSRPQAPKHPRLPENRKPKSIPREGCRSSLLSQQHPWALAMAPSNTRPHACALPVTQQHLYVCTVRKTRLPSSNTSVPMCLLRLSPSNSATLTMQLFLLLPPITTQAGNTNPTEKCCHTCGVWLDLTFQGLNR